MANIAYARASKLRLCTAIQSQCSSKTFIGHFTVTAVDICSNLIVSDICGKIGTHDVGKPVWNFDKQIGEEGERGIGNARLFSIATSDYAEIAPKLLGACWRTNTTDFTKTPTIYWVYLRLFCYILVVGTVRLSKTIKSFLPITGFPEYMLTRELVQPAAVDSTYTWFYCLRLV